MSQVANILDHDANAYKVHTTVFRQGTRDTSVKLKRGEHLFILTDKGISEAPQPGPDTVYIFTDYFGCWPVVAIRVRRAHLDKWRSLPMGVIERMMARIRRHIEAEVAA